MVNSKLRLGVARRVRDRLKEWLGTKGYALVSIRDGQYSVRVRVYEKAELDSPVPREMDGIHIAVDRIPRSS